MSETPLLVIGLDGVDFRYLDQFADDLPTINELRSTGTEAQLGATHPPWTGSAWPSLYTGVDPSHHGVFDFFDFGSGYPDDAEIVNRTNVDAPAIWNYLTAAGRRSIVVNVPITHPAEEIDGVLIPGYLAPEDEPGYPQGIREDLSTATGRPFRIHSEHETAEATGRKIDGFESLIRDRGQAAAHLLETEDWDFGFVQFQKTDSVFHSSSSTADFRRIFEATDEAISYLLDACETEPNVLLVSDHGMGPVTGHTVYVNELLREHGYITTESNPTDLSLSNRKGKPELDDEGTTSAVGTMIDFAKRVGFDPTTAYRVAERIGIEGVLLRLLPHSVKQSLADGVDWRKSAAYCRRVSEQGIRINLQGREPDGVVAPDEYESVRDELIELLSSLETDDGEPIFEYVCRREAIYEGPFTDDAPDVLFRTAGMNHDISTKFHGTTIAAADTYNHKESGVFVAAGPDIDDDWDGSTLSLLDVAPIAMATLSEPIPERLQGSVPDSLVVNSIERDAYGDVPYGKESAYEQDQQEVTDRLSDLGYL